MVWCYKLILAYLIVNNTHHQKTYVHVVDHPSKSHVLLLLKNIFYRTSLCKQKIMFFFQKVCTPNMKFMHARFKNVSMNNECILSLDDMKFFIMILIRYDTESITWKSVFLISIQKNLNCFRLKLELVIFWLIWSWITITTKKFMKICYTIHQNLTRITFVKEHPCVSRK